MKPRLRKMNKIWYCWTQWTMGEGFNPLHAYDDWLLQALEVTP